MKKFLLLLVGVLFALSAKAADYYLVGDMNSWKTDDTYKFEAVGDGTYKLVVPVTITAGQTYKICAGMNADNSINWSVNIGAYSENYELSYNSSYDAKDDSQSSNFKWKETADSPIIYLSKFFTDNGTNKVTITVYKNEASSVYISGAFNNSSNQGSWVKPGDNDEFKFTYEGDGIYTLDLTGKYSLKGNKEFKIYKDSSGWSGGTQYSTNGSDLVVGTAYKATTGGSNITVSTEVTNPVIKFDAITQYITITEGSTTPVPTTYYYKLHGQIFASGDSWNTQKLMTDNSDGTYSFEATLYAGSFGIKELPKADAAINDDNTWIRAASGTGTINKANTTYAVAYEGGANDGKANLTSTLTGEYTIVFNKKDMTITFVPKVATVDYVIYFDAVRSGWESVSVSGVTATVEDDGTKALKKISYRAVEGTEVTFSNGTNSYKVIPTNGNVYYVESSSLQNGFAYNDYSYTPPTPAVKTAYTIYFDTFQSGWRKVTLLNDGVEVVGSLVKAGYIHGANEDGVEGYLHKYTVNTTDATKLTFTNGTASYPLSTITDGNVYYVSESRLADAALASYKVNADLSYRLHGQILGNSSWDTYKMTYFDGLWIYEANNFVAGNFGIKKLGKDEAVDKSETSTNPWIYAVTKEDNAHHVVIGAATNCALQGSDQATENSGNFYSSVEGKYTLVFDPEAMTIMFINPAVAATAEATVELVSTTSHANKLSVTIKVSDYSSVIGGYALSNGTFTTVSTENTFTNVPYASNYTLTVGSASMPINITLPAEPTFNIKAIKPTTFAPAAGQTNGILSVAFTVETTWAYNLPHVICTCNGVVVPGNVEWSTDGFTFSAAEAVPITTTETGYTVTENMTFKFVITPEYPFIVNSASTRGQMRVSGTGYQTVLGTAITNAEAKLTGGNIVSGVEGLVIEAEDAPVEYFNLQGQRVNGDLAPGIYIRRQGTTVTKVRI